MRPVGLAAFALAAAFVASACSLVAPISLGPPTLECGPGVDRPTCERLAARVIADKRVEARGRRIVSLRIGDARGSYELIWDDGTGEALIVD